MALDKRNEFSTKLTELADLSKVLSHPARLAILNILSDYKDRTCKELVAELPLAQPTVSQHLKDLLAMELICRKQQGSQSLYCIEWNKLERYFILVEAMSEQFMPKRPKRNCC